MAAEISKAGDCGSVRLELSSSKTSLGRAGCGAVGVRRRTARGVLPRSGDDAGKRRVCFVVRRTCTKALTKGVSEA